MPVNFCESPVESSGEVIKGITAAPHRRMKKDNKRETLIFSSSPSHRCEIENIKTVCANGPHGNFFIVDDRGNKSPHDSNDTAVMLALVDPIKFVPENLDKCSESQSSEVQQLDPISACYSLAKRLRKKLNFREYMEAVGGYCTNLWMDGKQVANSRNGNKKDRRMQCAAQALAMLSMDEKINPVILDCLRKRTSSKERINSHNAPIVSKTMNDCKSTLSKKKVRSKGSQSQKYKKGFSKKGKDKDGALQEE